MRREPSAFTWLRRNLTETVTPRGRLRPNLHRLDVKDWICFEATGNGREHLLKKQEIFQSQDLRSKHLLQFDGSQGPQQEVLELLLDHLPQMYPEHFQVTPGFSTGKSRFGPETQVNIEMDDFKASYVIGDFKNFPLELASRLVQEDLVLVEDGTVVAGSVLFSFSRFHERFGLNMDEIHKKVHQYQMDLEKPVNKIFASLSSDRPMWRSNWNISWSDDILAGYSRYPHRNPGISPDERAALFQEMRERIAERGLGGSAWLKVEYQTLRRLCNHPRVILFTVRTFLNSLDELKGEPLAAKALLQNLERLQTAEFRKYLGIDDQYLFESLRGYVKTCVVDVE